MEAKQYKYYKAQINYHRTDDLKPGSLPNNSIVCVQAGWIADEGIFKGEMIFSPTNGLWLPERDLELLEEITFEQYLAAGSNCH